MGNATYRTDVMRLYYHNSVGILLWVYRQYMAWVGGLGLFRRVGELARTDLPEILGAVVFHIACGNTA